MTILAGAIFGALPLEACNAAYPEQLIKVIVTFPPCGSADCGGTGTICPTGAFVC